MVSKLKEWIKYIQVPRSELGNYSVCPYASTVSNQLTIEACELNTINSQINQCNIIDNKVCIFYLLNYLEYSIEALEQMTKYLNEQYMSFNKVVLDSDPRTPFSLNGVVTNFPDCYIWIVQDLNDLTNKSNKLFKSTYYDYWSQEQLNDVVTWRTNIYNGNEIRE
jgi:hypothetical protein